MVGYVGRLWSVTLARWFRATAGKRPTAGRFPPGTPPALYPDLTRRTRPGATKATPATVTHRLYSTVTDETRDIPTYSPQARPQSWSPTPETQTHPRRRLVSQPGNPHPSYRSRTNPTAKQTELERNPETPIGPRPLCCLLSQEPHRRWRDRGLHHLSGSRADPRLAVHRP